MRLSRGLFLFGLAFGLSLAHGLSNVSCPELIQKFYQRPGVQGFRPIPIDPSFNKKALHTRDGWSGHIGQEVVIRSFPTKIGEQVTEVHGILVASGTSTLGVLKKNGDVESISLQSVFSGDERILAEVKPELPSVVRERMNGDGWSEKSRELFDSLKPEDLAHAVTREPSALRPSLGATKAKLESLGANVKGSADGYQLEIESMSGGATSRNAKGAFYEHRDFPQMLRELRDSGYKVEIEDEFNPSVPTLRISNFGKTDLGMSDAAFNGAKRSITVRSDSPFTHFAHEFEHFKFETEVKQVIGLNPILQLLDEAKVATLTSSSKLNPLLNRVVEDIKTKGLHAEADYEEFLSYSREVAELKKTGYAVFSRHFKQSLERKWEHEAEAFDMNSAQARKLRAKRFALEYLTDPAILTTLGAIGVFAGVVVPILVGDDEDTVTIYDPKSQKSTSFSLDKFADEANREMDEYNQRKAKRSESR